MIMNVRSNFGSRWLLVMLLLQTSGRAAFAQTDPSGDVAIYREATAGENYNSTTPVDVQWDTTVKEDANTFSRTGATVTLSKSGHYLVCWSMVGDTAGGANRAKLEGLLSIAGGEQAYGRGWGYLRDSSTSQESYAQGATIITANAGDALVLRVFRQDTNTVGQEWQRRAGLSGMSLLKLNDTWAYGRYREAGGGQDVYVAEGSKVILDLDATDEEDAGLSRSGGTITLASAGHYLLAFNIGLNSSGSERTNTVAAAFLNGSEVAGTRVTGYVRNQNGDQEGGLSYLGILSAAAGDALTIRVWNDLTEGASPVTVDGTTTAVTVAKLPDTADFVRLHEAGGAQNLSAAQSSITFDTDDEVDGAFSRTGASDEIAASVAGDYLFSWSSFARKPSAEGTREHLWTKLTVDGSLLPYGTAGSYIRGDQGGVNCPSAGASVGALLTLTAGQIVRVVQENEATDANAELTANGYAVQAVRIGPEMSVAGNGTEIVDGDTTPTVGDDTAFGDSQVGNALQHTFTIANAADAPGRLNLTGNPLVSLTGSAAFSVTTQPAATVLGAGNSTTFTVQFSPTAVGTVTATVSIAGNDRDENPYNFDVSGNGTSPSVPEMAVSGKGVEILDGDGTPSSTDDTDFGSVLIAGGTADHVFTVTNSGSADLSLTGTPKVVIGGTHAGDFSVTAVPSSPVSSGGGTTTFTVRFDPAAEGVRSATISIANDDSDENPYNFSIQGTGLLVATPEMAVSGQGVEIVAGDGSPSPTDDTDFGLVLIAGGTLDHVFTITNSGTADLNLTGTPKVVIGGTHASDFSVTAAPSSPVASGGGTTTFTIRFDPSAGGVRSATVSIANDDSDENPYGFSIQGIGTTISLPVLSSPTVSGVGATTATLGATLDSDGTGTITQRGTVWGLSANPTGNAGAATGTGLGAFSHPRTGLPAGSLVYYRGYAVNESGTGYSPDGSFYTEPATQASGVTFSGVERERVQVNWARGSGSGVIVLAKQGAAADAVPVDGTTYTASPFFGSGTQIGTANYVVYIGTNASAPIYMLAENTQYSVGVFEYSGSGAQINYLQASPAVGTQTTASTIPGHNLTHGIQCDECHFPATVTRFGGGFLLPRGSQQDTVCKSCHQPTGVAAGASDVAMHMVRQGTKTIDCGSCHEVHNNFDFSTDDTHTGGVVADNVKWVRPNTKKYVTNAVEPVIFQQDPGHFAFDTADPPYTGICQTCHMGTRDHTNHGSGSDNSHQMGTDCRNCHQHGSGYALSKGCTICHDQAQGNRRQIVGTGGDFDQTSVHVSGTITDDDCLGCHNTSEHGTGNILLNNPDTGGAWTGTRTDFCLTCHDGTPPTGVSFPASHGTGYDKSASVSSTHGQNLGPANSCGHCHNAHGSPNVSLLSDTYVISDFNNYSSADYDLCWRCHDENNIVSRMSNNAFRNRHEKHVIREDTSCFECHDVHAPADPGEAGLIDMQTPINEGYDISYRGNDDASTSFWISGSLGYCSIKCHGKDHTPKDYDRSPDQITDCGSCHGATSFNHDPQPSSCGTCHSADRPVAPHTQTGDCGECHFDPGVTWLGATYDHIPTPASCTDCHSADRPALPHPDTGDCGECHLDPGVTWLGATYDHDPAPATCGGCHDSDRPASPHPQTEDCSACHLQPGVTWLGATYDHDPVPSSCEQCHAADRPADPHPQTGDCSWCHNDPGGSFVGGYFDHTPTPTECAVCHESIRPAAPHIQNADCVYCHFEPGVRWLGASPGSCTACHSAQQGTRRQVVAGGGDFERISHHVTDGTTTEVVTDADCEVCHDQTQHQQVSGPTAYLTDPDGGTAVTYDGTGASVESVCLGCHDADSSTAYDSDGNAGNGNQPFSDGSTPVDIDTEWAGSSHNANLTAEACLSCHGGTDSTRTGLGYDQNAHGSTNSTLLSSLVAGTTVTNTEEELCFACHKSGGTASADVQSDFAKTYRHPVLDSEQAGGRSVECTDCHAVHAATGGAHDYAAAATSSRNQVSAALTGVSGVQFNYGGLTNFQDPGGNYTPVASATYEYQICFKCHSSYDAGINPDVGKDRAQEFNPKNRSFHPVIAGLGDASSNSSALNSAQLSNTWNNPGTQTMMCSDCQTDSSAAAQGPHGSAAAFMLRGPNTLWPPTDYIDGSPDLQTVYETSFCANCHTYTADNRAHDKHKSRKLYCYSCHIVIPHGGGLSRLIGDNNSNMPAQYAYQGVKSNLLVRAFRKQNDYTQYGKADCSASGGCSMKHPDRSGQEQW